MVKDLSAFTVRNVLKTYVTKAHYHPLCPQAYVRDQRQIRITVYCSHQSMLSFRSLKN